MHKILFLSPPFYLKDNDKPYVEPPLGILYLASVLERSDFEVEILDCVIEEPKPHDIGNGWYHFGLTFHEIERRLERTHPDVVCISTMFSNLAEMSRQIAKIAKTMYPDVPIVHGGVHPTVLPSAVLNDGYADFVVLGEGERTLVELLNALDGTGNVEKVKGIAWRVANGAIKFSPQRETSRELDELPFPARHLIDLKKYWACSPHIATRMRREYANMITSRGCPYQCVFCSVHTIAGRTWRSRSPANVVSEIEELYNRFGVREIHFEDDNLSLRPDRLSMICDLIVERGLDIRWTTPNGVHANHLSRSLLKNMKRSGCYAICIGVENGDQNFLQKVIRKHLDLNRVRQVLGWCKELNLFCTGFFILGIPGEDFRSFENTIGFAINSNFDLAEFYLAAPYPGTDLEQIAKSHGYFIDLDPKRLRGGVDAVIKTPQFTPEDILRYQRRAQVRFLKHALKRELYYFPRRISRSRDIEEGVWYTKLMLYALTNIMKKKSIY